MISPESKPQVYDRVFVLEAIDGKPKKTDGIIDPSLFTEDADKNELYGIMDPETCLWTFRYKRGTIPPALGGRYTGLNAMTKFAENYFRNRNIKIAEVRYKE